MCKYLAVEPKLGITARVIVAALSLVALFVPAAYGDVQTVGNVIPARNPFDPANFPGLPVSGNFINPGNPPEPNPLNPSAQNQTTFEGIVQGGVNVQVDVIVGQTSFGAVLISGNTALRDNNLIIGDTGQIDGQTRFGSGVVRISGFGALYNNDYTILPFGLDFTTFGSKREAGAMEGYDLYVGRAGTGTLEISAGGRAEIQDAVVVGNDPGSTGSIIVDGLDSFLGSGGFEAGVGSTGNEPHQMLIGRRGVGFMTISGGGTVVSEAPTGTSASDDGAIGAVIGSDPFTDENAPAGGRGTVTATGSASKWIVGGSLQVGGFSKGATGTAGEPDLEGDNTVYSSEAGRGTLYVSDGALINIRPAIGAGDEDPLSLLIGRFGRVDLSGGLISVGGGTPGSQGESRPDTVGLINDGVINGSGRIETGVFRNRYFGEVRVDAGQSLVIDSSAQFTTSTTGIEPLANWGVIRALGTADARAQFEIERAPDAPENPIMPFRNLRVERPTGAPPADFYGGLISAQHATLIFRSGLENQGMIAFTAGTNYVTGNVFNVDPDLLTPDDEGIIIFSGPDTTVVFENDLLSTGTIIVEEGADVDVLARHSFVTAGELRYSLNPTNSSRITTAGDVGIAGKLSVSLTSFAPGSLSIGDSFELISFGGQIGGVDLTDPLRPRPDLTIAPLFTQLQLPNLTAFGLPSSAIMLPVYLPNSIMLSIFSIGAAMGGDFNGDGVVDELDLAIWKMNKGIITGGTILQGDANGDGAVDGADYLLWLEQFTMGSPGSGAGGIDFGEPSASVPEPAGLVLMLTGGMLALAFRRRRT